MKQLVQVIAMAVLGGFILTSCGEDTLTPSEPTTDNPPTVISFSVNGEASTGSGNHAPAGNIEFDITFGDDIELSSYEIRESASTDILDSGTASGTNWLVSYTHPIRRTADNGFSNLITFIGTDTQGQQVSESYQINVVDTLYSYSITLGGDQNATGSFYAAIDETGQIYTVSSAFDNQEDVDLVYFYGATNQASLAAPSDTAAAVFSVYNLNAWTTRNATEIHASTADFTGANNSLAVQDAFDASLAQSRASNLSVGDVIAFRTVDGVYGLISVTDIDDANGRAGTITFDVKVQP